MDKPVLFGQPYENIGVSVLRRIIRSQLILVLLSACLVSIGSSIAWGAPGGDQWQVRRKNRSSILIRRYKSILHKTPYSTYAFRRLMGYYRSRSRRLILQAEYIGRVRSQPKNIAYKILLGRLYLYDKQYQSALAIFQQVASRQPNATAVKLSLAHAYIGLKQPRQAMALYRQVLPKIKSTSRKKRMLQRMLEVALKARDQVAIRYATKAISTHRWSLGQRLSLSRLYVRYNYPREGRNQLQQALKKTRGRAKVRILLELIRLLLQSKAYDQALARINEARKMGTLHKWLFWELQMHEIEVHRRTQRLALLTARLDRKWKRTRDFKKIVLLARLYEELKVPQEAEKLYLKAMKLRPSAREPRLQLIKWYSKQKKPDKVSNHIEQLIKYKHAAAKHYFQIINKSLKESKRPSLPRWSPSWPRIYKRYCQQASRYKKRSRGRASWRQRYYQRLWRYRRRYFARRYRRYSGSAYGYQYKCSRKSWENYRRKRWTQWRTNQSTASQRKAFQKARQLMRSCLRHHTRDWDTLHELESLFARHGLRTERKRAFTLLKRTTGSHTHRLKAMFGLLQQDGTLNQFLGLAKRSLRGKWVAMKQGIELASYAYQPFVQPVYTSTKRPWPKGLPKPTSWRASICPSVKRFLQGYLRRSSKQIQKRTPEQLLDLSHLLWRCGDRSRYVNRTFLEIEALAQTQPDLLQKLVNNYIDSKAKKPLQRLLRSPLLRKRPQKTIELFQNYMARKAQQSENIKFLFQLVQQTRKTQPTVYTGLLATMCNQRKLCKLVGPFLKELVYQPNPPAKELITLLRRTTWYRMYRKERPKWLKHLINGPFANNPQALHLLAEAQDLFPRTSPIHLTLMIKSLASRSFAPLNVELWGQMLGAHINRFRYASRKRLRAKLIRQITRNTKRFPSLTRQLLSYLLSHYVFRREEGPRELFRWLATHHSTPDLELLDIGVRRTPTYNRKSWFSRYDNQLRALLKRASGEAEINWFMAFAHRYQQPHLYLDAMKRLYKHNPNTPGLLYRLALSLENTPGRAKEASFYWKAWFQKHPQLSALTTITRTSKQCCTDAHASGILMRMLQSGYRKHGKQPAHKATLWHALKQSLPKLTNQQQQRLLSWVAGRLLLDSKQLQELTMWAEQNQRNKLAMNLYEQLSAHQQLPLSMYKKLAEGLDASGQYKRASVIWKRYLKQSNQSPSAFWEQRIQQHVTELRPTLAGIASYRLHTMAKRPASPQALQTLLSNKQTIRAWGMWLYLQGKKGERCLERSTPSKAIPPHALHASTLLAINLGFRGPLLFYKRCQWELSSAARTHLIPKLVAYLKNNPLQKVAFMGSADPVTETDIGFLAKQRAISLQNELLQHGISDQRIQVKSVRGLALCTATNRSPITCQAYRRQVTLNTYDESKGRPLTYRTRFIPLNTWLRLDADRDRIPDAKDACPLQYTPLLSSSTRRSRYRWRYYRGRWRRRYGYYRRKTSLYRSWILLPPNRKQTKRKVTKGKPGCPTVSRLVILPLSGKQLKTKHQIVFRSRYSSYIYSSSQKILKQIAALLRIAPQAGHLRIHIHPSKGTSYRSRSGYRYYRGRWRRYRRRYTGNAWRVARYRAARILSFIKRQGVSSRRVSTHIHSPKSASTGKRQPFVTFRIIKK